MRRARLGAFPAKSTQPKRAGPFGSLDKNHSGFAILDVISTRDDDKLDVLSFISSQTLDAARDRVGGLGRGNDDAQPRFRFAQIAHSTRSRLDPEPKA